MKTIITISREYGAGGSTIGRIVEERLNYEYLDKAIILRTALEARVSVEDVLQMDEIVPFNFGFAQSLFDFYNKPVNEKLFEAQSKVMKRFAEKGRCIILGRNANYILKEYDRSLHVFICGSMKSRIERMLEKEMYKDTSEAKMREIIETIDKKRCKYCEYYTKTEFGDARHYDICLDSSRLGVDACADIICTLANR